MKTLILILMMAVSARGAVQITGGDFTSTPTGGWSIMSTVIDPGAREFFELTGFSDGDVIISLMIADYWTDPAAGWTGRDELRFSNGDVMGIKVPKNGTQITKVAIISTSFDYNGIVDEINADPTIEQFHALVTNHIYRPRVKNSEFEATIGYGSVGSRDIDDDHDADFGLPRNHAPIPEPNSIALLAMGLLALLRRSRSRLREFVEHLEAGSDDAEWLNSRKGGRE